MVNKVIGSIDTFHCSLLDRAYRPSSDSENLYHSTAFWVAVVLYIADMIFFIRSYALSNVVEHLLFALFLINSSLRSEFIKVCCDPVVAVLMAFSGWALLSILWSDSPVGEGLYDWWGWRKLFLFPIGLVLLQRPVALIGAKIIFGFAGVLFICFAVYGLYLQEPVWGRWYYDVMQNHNLQGIYFAIFGSALVVHGNTIKNIWLRLTFLALGCFFLSFMVLFGPSRSGYIASLAGFAVSGFFLGRRHLGGLALGLMMGIALLAISPTANNHINDAVEGLATGIQVEGGEQTSGSIRMTFWLNTFDIIKEHIVFGVGAASFDEAYAEQVRGVEGWRGTGTDDPHSHYLHLWVEYGLVGLLIFLFYQCLLLFSYNPLTPWGALGITVVVVGGVIGLFDGVYGGSVIGRTLQFTSVICLISFRKFHNVRVAGHKS